MKRETSLKDVIKATLAAKKDGAKDEKSRTKVDANEDLANIH